MLDAAQHSTPRPFVAATPAPSAEPEAWTALAGALRAVVEAEEVCGHRGAGLVRVVLAAAITASEARDDPRHVRRFVEDLARRALAGTHEPSLVAEVARRCVRTVDAAYLAFGAGWLSADAAAVLDTLHAAEA